MARKYELINDLYDQIIVDVTKDARAWQSFLRTACRNYKLRFDEQLLLFAQRPDATAVLEIERWNTAFGRWVNRGAKGIAVFEDSSGKSQRLKYYFDITDTHGTKRSREVPVWKMSDEYQSDVTEALKNTFGTLSDLDSLESVIKESVSNAVDDNIDDYIYNFIRNGTGSEIDYISTDEAEEIYKRLVKNSVVYMISERLGADSGLTESDFEGIEYFSTHELLNSIGYATSDIAKMGLGVVAKTVRAIEKENQQAIMPDNNISYNSERSSNYERNHLHNAGRLSDSGSFITGTAGGNTRQMGTDEKGISEAAPQDNVLQSDDELSVNTVPRRNGTESAQTGGRADQRDVGKTGADRRAESERYDEMGSADEQSQTRSSRDSYSADNNERLSNIKPLPSINEQTAFVKGKGWLYSWGTLNNIPWILCHLSWAKTLLGQPIRKDSDVYKAIMNNCHEALFCTDERHKGYSILTNKPGEFVDISYCLIQHQREIIDDNLIETFELKISNSKNEAFFSKQIKVDEMYFLNLINKNNEHFRNKTLLDIAQNLMPDL